MWSDEKELGLEALQLDAHDKQRGNGSTRETNEAECALRESECVKSSLAVNECTSYESVAISELLSLICVTVLRLKQ